MDPSVNEETVNTVDPLPACKAAIRNPIHRILRWFHWKLWCWNVRRKGGKPSGAYDDLLWMESFEVKAERRMLNCKWTVDEQTGFVNDPTKEPTNAPPK